jgi:hypothetical protein
MSKYWKRLVQVVRSRSVVEHVRMNLLLEKQRQLTARTGNANATANSTIGFETTFNGSQKCYSHLQLVSRVTRSQSYDF